MSTESPAESQMDEHVLAIYLAWGEADIEQQRPVRRDWPYLAGVLDELCEWLSED